MKYDSKIKQKVKELHNATKDWCNYVDGFGCQCAYTDRILEKIDGLCAEIQEIQKLRQKEFDKLSGNKGGK